MKKILFLLLCSVSFGYIGPVTNFNSGQVSPLIEARGDFAKYSSSCRTLENMFVTVQGPALKRPGTEYIATAKDAGKIRLIPFEFSTDDAYILEFGDNYLRFYRNGAQILDGDNFPVEIETQHQTSDLFNMQFVQTDNAMYIVDNENPPQILTRTSHTDWAIRNVPFTNGPFLPENDLDISITPSRTTGNITLTCSAEIFKSTPGVGHKGSLWAIEQVRASSIVSGTFSDNGTSLSTPFFIGGYSFTTTGTGTGTTTLQRSTNNGISWRNALTPLTNQFFDNPAEFEEDGAIYRVTLTGSNQVDINYNFTIADNINKGVVKITGIVSSTVANASVITELADTSATTTWREGYWSDFRGWPGTLTFHQQRLVYGGSDSFPQELWFGEQNPDDYANFLEGSLDTAAFTFALEGQNPIRWLLSQDYLLIGTSGSCGKWGEQGKSATPTSPSFQKQTRNGSFALAAMFAGDDIIYVERGGRKVRRFGFDLQSDKYLSPELTVLSPEITDSGILNADFQLRPDPILWCVLNNGDIATLTHQPEQSVIAWTKQVTDGDFESVAVISSGDNEDEVWVSVERILAGARYIERFKPHDWGSDDDDLWFVDSGLSYDGGAAITVTGATQADPGVITAGTHGFSDGDQVLFSSVGGMVELNGNVYTVASSDADTFELKDATGTWDYDTSGFTAYTSGGSVQQVEDTFTGLDHLEGETVKVWADGIVLSDEVVVNGAITIDVASSTVAVGLPYTAKIETLPIRVDPQDISLNKKIKRLWVDLYKSGTFKFGPGSTADLSEVNMWEEATLTAKQDLYTSTAKMKQFSFIYAGFQKQTVYVESSEPVPFTVRAIVAELEGRR